MESYMSYEAFFKFLSCNEVTDDNVLKFVFYLLESGLLLDVMDLDVKVIHMLDIDIYSCVFLK